MVVGLTQQPLFHNIIDINTDTVKVFVNLIVRYPNHQQTPLFQQSCSSQIIRLSRLLKMLGTVQLNNYLGLGTIKINYVVLNYFLPQKPYGIVFQKAVPQAAFLFSHIFAQFTCSRCKRRVMLFPLQETPPPWFSLGFYTNIKHRNINILWAMGIIHPYTVL